MVPNGSLEPPGLSKWPPLEPSGLSKWLSRAARAVQMAPNCPDGSEPCFGRFDGCLRIYLLSRKSFLSLEPIASTSGD